MVYGARAALNASRLGTSTTAETLEAQCRIIVRLMHAKIMLAQKDVSPSSFDVCRPLIQTYDKVQTTLLMWTNNVLSEKYSIKINVSALLISIYFDKYEYQALK